ncbi:MAG: ABC transporter ATP-binding protein [Thermoplasmata archaeon]
MPGKESDQPEDIILKVNNLNVHFFTRRGEIKAIRGISFYAKRGEILGIVGESGSGKSVTALSLVDLLPTGVGFVTDGDIILNGQRVSDLYKREYKIVRRRKVKLSRRRVSRKLQNRIQKVRGHISMIFQDPLTSLDPLYKVKAQMIESLMFNNRITLIKRVLEKNDLNKNKKDLIDSIPSRGVKSFIEEIRKLYGSEGFYQELLLIENSTMDDPEKVTRIIKAIRSLEQLSNQTVSKLEDWLKNPKNKIWKPKNSKKYRFTGRTDKLLLVEAELYSFELLEFVDMPHPDKVLESYPHELSGGMKQRIMIALGIANKPDILIADEPTTALDVITQYQILYLLKTLNQKLGLTIIFITHDLGVMAAIADRIVVMYAGKISEIGPTKYFLTEPLHPYTKGLLKSVPSISNERGELYTIPGQVPDLLNPPNGCAFANRCSFALEKCTLEEPPTLLVNGRKVSCWLYEVKENGK